MEHRTSQQEWAKGLADAAVVRAACSGKSTAAITLSQEEIEALVEIGAMPLFGYAMNSEDLTDQDRASVLALARLRRRILEAVGIEERWDIDVEAIVDATPRPDGSQEMG